MPCCPLASKSGLLSLWLEPSITMSKTSPSVAGHALPWTPGIGATALSEIGQPWLGSGLLPPPAWWGKQLCGRNFERTDMLDQKDTDGLKTYQVF